MGIIFVMIIVCAIIGSGAAVVRGRSKKSDSYSKDEK